MKWLWKANILASDNQHLEPGRSFGAKAQGLRPLASSSSWHRCGRCGFQSDQCPLSWKVAIDKHINIYQKYDKQTAISRYFQIFPAYSPIQLALFSQKVLRDRPAQRHATVVRHLVSSTWLRMGLKRWTYATVCIRLAEFAAKCYTYFHFTQFQYVSICFK